MTRKMESHKGRASWKGAGNLQAQSTSGACFSKVLKLFRHFSGDIIPFVSTKQRPLEARNFEVILIFISFTTYEKISLTE